MENETVDNVEEIETEEHQEESGEAAPGVETDKTETTEDEEQEKEESEAVVDDWMKDDDDKGEGDKDEKPVKFLKAKKKLKGVIAEKEDELERLRAENETLKSKKQEPKAENLKRPDPLDYDTDEEYNAAVDDYNVSLFEARQQSKRQEAEVRRQLERIEASVSDHYERAETLIQSSGISPEKYKAADANLRGVFNDIFGKNGDISADAMLGSLGAGSEKVGYYIGNNETARMKLKSLFEEDPTGIKAAMFLGAQNNRLNNPQRRTTNARPPGSKVAGEKAIGQSATSLKKKYEEAHKAKKGQEAYNIKRQAKLAGVDVSGW